MKFTVWKSPRQLGSTKNLAITAIYQCRFRFFAVALRIRSAPDNPFLLRRASVGLALPCSLPSRRLPKFDLVPFGIDDPGKFPVLGFIDFFEHLAAFFLQGRD